MSSECYPAHSVGIYSPLLIKMAVWRYFLIFEFFGSCVAACCKLLYNGCLARFKFKKKCAKRPILSAVWMPHPTRSLSRIICRGQEGFKAAKTLLGVISRPILDLCYFKGNVTTRNRKDDARKSGYIIVSSKQLRDTEA